MLRGTAAGENGDAQAGHYGGPGDAVVVPENFPTAIVTVDPGGAFVLPAGSCVWTIPSWFGSVTGWGTTCTLNPDARSCVIASACEMLVTSGTVEVVGPFETVSVIVAPGGWYVPPSGLWAMTES